MYQTPISDVSNNKLPWELVYRSVNSVKKRYMVMIGSTLA